MESALLREQYDEAKAENFAGEMLETLNRGCLALLISIGHQTKLFEILATMPPSTSQKIADSAGLRERYVRELLGGLVVGGVVEYDPSGETYALPPEHAGLLTAAAGPDNLAMFMQYVPLLGEVEQEVIECFRNGGGVPYSSFERFQAVQGEESRLTYDAILLDSVLPLDPGIVASLDRGIEVADIGCGEGHATILMAERFPRSRFTGYDLSPDALATARQNAAERGLSNIGFEVADIAELELEPRYGLVTAFDSIHDQASPDVVLRKARRALEEKGIFLMVDIQTSSRLEENLDHPFGTALYAISTMHCMTVSLAQDGQGLGTCWGEQKAQEMLAEAGFGHVDLHRLDGNFFHSFFVCRP